MKTLNAPLCSTRTQSRGQTDAIAMRLLTARPPCKKKEVCPNFYDQDLGAYILVMKLEGPSFTEPVQMIRVESTPSMPRMACWRSAASPSANESRSITL